MKKGYNTTAMTNQQSIKPIIDELSNVLYVNSAIKLMKMSAGIDADNTLENNRNFSALCEAVVFDNIAKKPFFEIIKCLRPSDILKGFKTHSIIFPKKFTYKECYEYLLSFNIVERREIIESLPLSTKEFNSILNALDSENLNEFNNALNNCESTEWLGWVVVLQYVSSGTLKPKFSRYRKNLWLSGLGFEKYFRNANGSNADEFLDNEQMRWSGILHNPSRKRVRKTFLSDSVAEVDIQNAMGNYTGLFCSLYNLWDASGNISWTNYEEVLKRAKIIADAIFKHEFVHNNRVISQPEHDRMEWESYLEDLDYFDTNIVQLSAYVSTSASAMVEIFDLIKTLLPYEISSAIDFMLNNNPYTVRAMEIKSEKEMGCIADMCISHENADASSSLTSIPHVKDASVVIIEKCFNEFLNEDFNISETERKHFVADYQSRFVEFIASIKTSQSFFALVYLFYPVKMLQGKGNSDHVSVGEHLGRGIRWKNEPIDSERACDRILSYFPDLKKWIRIGESTKTPSKCVNCLVKEVRKGNSWIESFIQDYWPNDPMTDFNEKLKKTSK